MFDNLLYNILTIQNVQLRLGIETRSSWLNCALRDDEAVQAQIGHYEATDMEFVQNFTLPDFQAEKFYTVNFT